MILVLVLLGLPPTAVPVRVASGRAHCRRQSQHGHALHQTLPGAAGFSHPACLWVPGSWVPGFGVWGSKRSDKKDNDSNNYSNHNSNSDRKP